ncbi:MAG: oligopeptide:H+ symporter [Bacteroidetes bacterium]|nr:oligopeptide:H+ symporter [Bacteroidota bacterium]
MNAGLALLIAGWVFVLIWVPIVVLSQRKMHPKALFTLFFAELWERFSFYGMRAFLILYMTSRLFDKLSQSDADGASYGVYGAFNALLYASPLLGGMLADKLIGFRKAIITGGLFMSFGQIVLAYNAFNGDTELLFFVGLSFLAIGNGFFKPNISSFLGTFYDRNDNRKDSAFTIFYMGINIGAFLAPLTCGYLAREVHYSLGFLLAGLGMLTGVIVFYKNRAVFEGKGLPPDIPFLKSSFIAGINREWAVLIGAFLLVPVFSFLIQAEEITDYILLLVGFGILGYILFNAFKSDEKEEGQRLLVFMALFFVHMIFWALFEQAGGSINILTDRYVNKHGIETSQFQSVNALFIILLAPVFTWIWTVLGRKKLEPRTPMKFFYAMLQIALGYFIIVVGAKSILPEVNEGGLIPIVFVLGMYLFHTTGELSLSPVGLSVVTKLSPVKTVGFVMGSWFVSIAFGHKIGGYLGKLIASPPEGATKAMELQSFIDVYMNWGVYIVLGVAAILFFISPTLKKWMHGVH